MELGWFHHFCAPSNLSLPRTWKVKSLLLVTFITFVNRQEPTEKRVLLIILQVADILNKTVEKICKN
jgi:hypothetical protein